MIIEFCGLPGAGKSSLVKELNIRGYLERKELLANSSIGRINRHILYKYYPSISIGHRERLVSKFVKSQHDCDREYQIRLVEMAYAVSAKGDYILEEGPIQYISSIAYDYYLEENTELVRIINYLTKNEKLIFLCECPTETAYERLTQRNKNGDRFNVRDKTKAMELLQIKNNNIRTVLKYFSGTLVTLEMMDSLETNVEKVRTIISNLEGRL